MTKVNQELIDALSVTIPYPSHIPRGRGINAVGKFGTLLKSRCSRDERETVEQGAEIAGVSVSEFIRWTAVQTARRIIDREQGNRHPASDRS